MKAKEKVMEKWEVQNAQQCQTASLKVVNSQQADSTFESWAHVTLKNYHADPALEVFNAEGNTVKLAVVPQGRFRFRFSKVKWGNRFCMRCGRHTKLITRHCHSFTNIWLMKRTSWSRLCLVGAEYLWLYFEETNYLIQFDCCLFLICKVC